MLANSCDVGLCPISFVISNIEASIFSLDESTSIEFASLGEYSLLGAVSPYLLYNVSLECSPCLHPQDLVAPFRKLPLCSILMVPQEHRHFQSLFPMYSRTVHSPKCCPVKSINFEQPQLVDLPDLSE